jgi:hypothetical protein
VGAATGAALALLLTLTAGVWSHQDRTDAFSITNLYRSDPTGQRWAADWTREWSNDPWVERGSNNVRYRTENGVLTVTGPTSRLYVRNPDMKTQWGNVEVTVYGYRVADENIGYSGIVTSARTNHGVSDPLESAPCDSRAIAARMRFDGSIDFGKETSHPTWEAVPAGILFPGGLPYNKWIGYKHVVYDIPGGTRQELWVDLTEGRNGGTWRKVATHDDTGQVGEVACAPDVDPALPLTLGKRDGSESGLPNLSVLLRADGVDDLRYKWFSVRDIIPPRG